MQKYKHLTPPKRRLNRVELLEALVDFSWVWMVVIVAVIVCIVNHDGGEPTPVTTSQPYYITITPAPSPTPTPTVWAQYSINLDADLQRYITTEAEAREIDPTIVMAICEIESGCDPDKLGDGGNAVGLMQIQPIWHLDRISALGVTDLRDPYQNVDLGIDYLAELYATGHDTAWVLMAYNGGQAYATNMSAQGVISVYAQQVMSLAEALTESAQIIAAYE
jgi:soluble lytic murein transglycosylase-like protein